MCSSIPKKERSRIPRPLFLFAGLSLVGLLIAWPFVSPFVECFRIRDLLARSEVIPAFELAKRLAGSQPDCAECQFLLAKSARRSADFSTAAAALERARAAGWDATEIQFEQVLAIAQSGQVRSVERELKQLFESDLQEAEIGEVYEALASGHLAAFDAPEFLKSLDFWIEWRPDAIQPRLQRAEFFSRIQKYSEAADEYRILLQMHPDCNEARVSLGECLLKLNLAKEAAEQLQMSYDKEPTDHTALLLAKCLIQIDRSQEAQALLFKFRDTPNLPVRSLILEELGRWHMERDEAAMALDYFKESVRLAPESSSAWHSLSIVYSMLGNSKESENAKEVSQQTQQRCQRLFNAVTALSAKPESIELRMEAARVLFEQGMEKDAVAWLRTILAIDLKHPEANQLLS